jgi:CHAT domain-containing protein
MKARFRARCQVVQSFTHRLTSADATRATALLTFHIIEMPRTGKTFEVIEDVEVQIIREQGQWQVANWTRSVDAAAKRIAEADPSASVAELVAPLVPERELVRSITRQAIEANNDTRRPLARKLAAAATAIAAELRDDAAHAMAMHAEIVASAIATEANHRERKERTGRAYELAFRSGDPDIIAGLLAYRGRLLLDVDESSEAAERLFLDMAAREDEYSEPMTVVRAATNAGVTRYTRGDFRGAFALFRKAIDRSAQLGDPLGPAWVRLHIGYIYHRQNDFELALAEYRLALQAAAKNSTMESLARSALARTLRRVGNIAEAEREQEAALEIGRVKLQHPSLVAVTLIAMSEAAYHDGKIDLAVAHAAEGLKLAMEAGYHRAQIDALLTLAEIERSRGRYETALSHLEELQKIDAVEDLGYARPVALILAARCHHALGDNSREKIVLAEAIDHIERSRRLVAGGERQSRLFFQPLSVAYTMMAAAAARDGDAARALEFAERGRARVLFDLLESAGSPDSRATPDGDLGVDHTTPPALTQDDLDSIVGNGTVLLEYVVAEDETHLIVISSGENRKAKIAMYRVAAGREELERRVSDFARSLANRDLRYRSAAKELYTLLLRPAANELSRAKLAGIAAHGPLWTLPFESLIAADGTFVTEQFATFYVPSISAYRTLRARSSPARQSVLVVADASAAPQAPRLADAREEANELANIYGQTAVVRLGTSASERVVKKEAGAFSILHFAVHGVFDDRDPMYSHITLAGGAGENGQLEAWELARLPLRAEMVVLSGCDTGRGQIFAGEGLVGMSWALFVAGSRSAVVSHWRVRSRAARELMVDFHRRYRRAGGGAGAKAEALRQARLKMLRQPATRHPFYWSAFVLVGS